MRVHPTFVLRSYGSELFGTSPESTQQTRVQTVAQPSNLSHLSMAYTTLPVEENRSLALGSCFQVVPGKEGPRSLSRATGTFTSPEYRFHLAKERPFSTAFCLKGTFVGALTRFLSLTSTCKVGYKPKVDVSQASECI